LAPTESPNRRRTGPLCHERSAGRYRGRDPVRGLAQWEVERRNAAARPDRHSLPHAQVAFGALRDIERLDLAVIARRSLGRDAERIDQPRRFALGVADRLARLDTQRKGQLVEPLAEARHTVVEHALP